MPGGYGETLEERTLGYYCWRAIKRPVGFFDREPACYDFARMGTLNIDRYHAAMGDASYKDVTRVHGKPLSETIATFYVTQRKLPFAPVLGHERLIRLLVTSL